MSASEIRRLAVKALAEKREAAARVSTSIRYSHAMVSESTGAVVPPPTCEDIAMRVVEANALVAAYEQAIAIIEESFRQLTAPDKAPSEATKREAPYK